MNKAFKPLVPGDTIGIIAVSAPTEQARFARGVQALEGFGFKTRIVLDPSQEYGKHSYLFSSDTPARRAAALTELLLDPEIRAIIAARGAYGSLELLRFMKFGKLRKVNKPLIGFSDVTGLLLALYAKAGLRSIHGPTIESGFSKMMQEPLARQSCDALIALLTHTVFNPYARVELTPLGKSVNASGILIGGNLSMIVSLLGTPYEPDFKGKILFFEECAERPFRLHRMLLQLKLAGKFKLSKAVIIGSLRDCVHPKGVGPTSQDVLRDIFADLQLPVYSGLPLGHDLLNLPLPIGVMARISSNQLELVGGGD